MTKARNELYNGHKQCRLQMHLDHRGTEDDDNVLVATGRATSGPKVRLETIFL